MTPVELCKLVDAPPQSAAWHQLRKGGIGASEAAAVAGLDKFGTPFSVWAQKVADEWPHDENETMAWGTRLEAAVADHFADLHLELLVAEAPAMYVHPDRDWMRASPDRLLYQDEPADIDALVGLLEIKTSRMDHEWEAGPPDRVMLQVQHQLEVMGLGWAWVAVLLHGREYHEWYVERDDTLIGYLVQIETEFWQRVVDRNPPAVDGLEATTEALRNLWHARKEAEVALPVDAGPVIAELRRTRALAKTVEQDVEYLENQLKLMLGDAEIGLLDGEVAVTWKASTSQRLDVKALRAARPDVAAEFDKPTESRRLVLPKGRE